MKFNSKKKLKNFYFIISKNKKINIIKKEKQYKMSFN